MLVAAQHVYTNVEADQSPSGRGGFQTLLATQGAFGEADIQALEARSSYVLPTGAESAPRKRIVFPLDAGRVAIGQVVPLVGRDASGRGGRSLAHTLVVDAEAFAETCGDPFAVFDAAPFFTSIEAALAEADFAEAALPIREFAVQSDDDAMRRAMRRLPPPARRALAALALAEPDAPTLALVGTPEAAEPLLRAALLPLTPAERVRFAFDTYFYRGRLAHTPYRAVGLPDAPRGARYHVLHLDRLAATDVPPVATATPFAVWADARLAHSDADLDAFMRAAPDARATSSFLLENAESAPENAISAEVASRVPTLVRRRLAAMAARNLPAVLAERVASFIMAQRTPAEHLHLLGQGGLSASESRATLHAAYAAGGFTPPGEPEVEALRSILVSHPDDPLSPWAALWADDTDALSATLAAQPSDTYRAFVRRVFAEAPPDAPLRLLHPKHTAHFAEAIPLLPESDRPTLSAVARHLIDLGAIGALDSLAPYLDTLSPRALRKLADDIESLQFGGPSRFAECLTERVAALPSNSVGARLRRLIGLPEKRED